MAELVPVPLEHLVTRLLAEWRARRAIFDLPERAFHRPAGRDLSVSFHGERAATPAGPAAGPQSQMAQNVALAWLAGARIVELKTIQVNDRLTIPRPCIDARTIGFNVEWSQELRLADSLSEYLNAWVLVALLRALGIPCAQASGPFGDTLFDLSVGYDLKGISSDPIRRYLATLQDAGEELERRRPALPPALRDIPLDPRIVKSVTLSTFHGCPAEEIEKICEFLLCEVGVHTTVKMNPTLLGLEEVRHLLCDVLGYDHLRLDPQAFEHDLKFPEAVAMVRRLGALAERRGLSFGAKLTNTLVVRNHDTYFRDEVMYLSGQPLYVIAATLALKFREAVGAAMPISFSAGIDQKNFADAVAMGFVPVTACTDLLRPGGYGRMAKYLGALEASMAAVGAENVPDFILRACGHEAEARAASGGDALRAVREAAHRNARDLVARAKADPRYRWEKTRGHPRKIGSRLTLFDCISCDKCVPVCPNDANFVYETPARTVAMDEIRFSQGVLRLVTGEVVQVARSHQLANFADFCNECGNCDVFCPEDGGPFIEKPRFFGSLAAWRADERPMGFFVERAGDLDRLHGRLGGRTYVLELDRRRRVARFTDGTLCAEITPRTGALRRAFALPGASGQHRLPLGPAREMLALIEGILDPALPSPVNTPWLAR
jgi:putative selenate reductase